MKETYSYSQIVYCLDKLNIKREDQPNHKGWLGILCPNHTDNNFGSCSINLNNGVVSCFVCNYKRHILGVIQDQLNLSFTDAKNFINNNNIHLKNEKVIEIKQEQPKIQKEHYKNLLLVDFDPNSFAYTKQRGYTKEFCEKFNIKRCLTKKYQNYIVFPIIDSIQNINTFEARKLRKQETLEEYYKQTYTDDLEERFDGYTLRNYIKLRKGKLFKDGEPFYDDNIYYLLRPKVLYPIDSNVQNTIFNIDNLDRKKPLILVEGSGSLPKIWDKIDTNVSCFFGVKISEKQIQILNEFETVYHIPDPDKAGYESVVFLNKELKNNYRVINIKEKDTDIEYVDKIVEALDNELFMNSNEYMTKFFLEFQKH